MFAENSMYGVKNVNVDSKGRIILPTFTGASKDDLLLIEEENDAFYIYNEEYLNVVVECLGKDGGTLDTVKEIQKELETNFYSKIYKSCTVDAQGRINGGERFNKYNSLRVIGCRNYIKLEKTR